MYRKLNNALTDWKNKNSRKPLVIRGARQVGKTFLVRAFAQQHYQSLVEINFDQSPEKKQLFDSNDIDRSLQLLEIEENIKPITKDTLLFFDEVQAAPEVFHFLRYLFEQRPDIPVIAAGSLLEFLLQDHDFSMPVGRIEYLHMGPLDFEEFLIALGHDQLARFIESYQLYETIPQSIHHKLLYYTQLFFIIGGMPAAIRHYISSDTSPHNISEALREHQSILQTYEDDFSKYRKKTDHQRLKKVFQKLPALIANKLKYVNIDPNDKAKDLSNSLQLLELAKIFYKVKHSSANGIPLRAEVNDKIFKPLFLDIGLVASSLGLKLTQLTADDNNIMVNQGALAEQFIGQHLLYSRQYYEKPELFYWNREARNSSAEVDYLLSINNTIIPVEVKSGKTGTLKSLQLFIANKKSPIALRFNISTPAVEQQTTRLANKEDCDYVFLSLPLYLVCQSERLISAGLRIKE
ncbi:MAG: ATP-binding protein [Gammaproteobacteria bacterium]|nr:ATP-binding protein [Gammaproteobacteria bacterium]